MRTLIVTEFVSLDGVMQSPGGEPGFAHAGWVGEFFTMDLGAYKFEEQSAAEILLLGRNTYEGFAGAWPERAGDPMADKINAMEKYVVTSTMTEPGWENAKIIAGPVDEAVAELKASGDAPILIAGSRTLAQYLLAAGLVDQINLQIFPLILGSGDRFYPETPDRRTLELIESTTSEGGVLMQSYAVAN
jgi:dihydrofolate reductase